MDEIQKRFLDEKKLMDRVFGGLVKKSNEKEAAGFFDMAFNYYKDSSFFSEKKDFVRAYEAIVISWSYVDAGLKMGFFDVPEALLGYFTMR